MIEVVAVPAHLVGAICDARRDLLERAAEASTETPESLVWLGTSGNALCWAAVDRNARNPTVSFGQLILGLGFTQLLNGPKGLRMQVLAMGGEHGARWLRKAQRIIWADAKARGAQSMFFVRITGKRTYFGMTPKGYYYEERL